MSHAPACAFSRGGNNAKISSGFCSFKDIDVPRIFMIQKDQKGSMIADTFTINVHACVVVNMYLIFVMTGQNISRRAHLHQSDVN